MELQKTPTPSLSTKSKSNMGLILGVGTAIALLLGGLVYTNLMLMSSNKKVTDISNQVASVEQKATKLEELSKKGATDELLGFDKVNKDGFQGVFLDGGQVYFGKITSMNTENIVIEDIYYLRDNSGNDQSLVKLGCELHKPEDKMTIIRSNVQFWENLEDDGQVVKAIKDYKKQNPQGQKCS